MDLPPRKWVRELLAQELPGDRSQGLPRSGGRSGLVVALPVPSRVPLSVQGARSQERTLCRGHRDGTRAARRWGLAPAWWVKVERNQPGKASLPRVPSRVSSRGRSSRVARLQASRPHLPRLPAPARPAGLRREPPLRLWQRRLRGRLPGAGRGRGRRGRAGHVGGRRAGDPSRRQAGWRGARTQSRLAAAQHFPRRTLLGSQGRLGKERGDLAPGACPAPIWEIIYWVRERVRSLPNPVPPRTARGICIPTGYCGDSEPWAARAARAGEGPGQALGAPASPTRLTLGVSGPARASLSPTVGVRIRTNPRAPSRFSGNTFVGGC